MTPKQYYLVRRNSQQVEEGGGWIGTLVATCMINKWTVKINEKEIYNEKCPPRGREAERKRQKKEDGCNSYHP